MVGSSFFSGSAPEGGAVFESKTDVVLSVDRGIIHQRMPVFCREFCQLIRQFLKGFEEGLVIGPLRLLAVDFFGDRIEAGLDFIEPLGKAVIAFLVGVSVWSGVSLFGW